MPDPLFPASGASLVVQPRNFPGYAANECCQAHENDNNKNSALVSSDGCPFEREKEGKRGNKDDPSGITPKYL